MPEMLIVVDTETTGLPKNLSSDVRPVSFGAVAYLGPQMEEVDSIHFIMRPDVWADGFWNAERVHGLSKPRLECHGLSMKDGWDRAVKWMHAAAAANQCNIADVYFMAWNSKFDRLVMSLWRNAAGTVSERVMGWPTWKEGQLVSPDGCVQHTYREWTETQPGIRVPRYGKLSEAAQTLGVGSQATVHNALADARLAGGILNSLRQRQRR